jgi:hypothetical protein
MIEAASDQQDALLLAHAATAPAADVLCAAARAGDAQGVGDAIARAAGAVVDSRGRHALALASTAECVLALLRAGCCVVDAVVDAPTRRSAIFVTRSVAAAAALLRAGASVTQVDSGGNTPLIAQAAAGAGVELLRCLVAAGADVNAKNARKETALHFAARSDAASVELLLAAKADPRVVATKGQSALMAAVACVDALTLLIRAGAPLNAKDSPQRRTALHHALIARRFDAAKLLIEAGCDIKSCDSAGKNPITLAAIARATEIVALLERRDAGPIINHHVIAALSWSDVSAIPLLRERGMKPTPADWLASSGSPQLMRELVRAGADVHWTGRNGRTILDSDYTVPVASLRVLAEHGFDFLRTRVMFYNPARQAPYVLSLLEVAPELIETEKLFATLIWCTRRMRVILACGYDVVGKHIERNYTGIEDEHQALLYACGAASIENCGERPLVFTGTREQFLQTANGASLLAKAQRDIARERVDLIRERATTICIGLQDLALPAWVTVQILLQACAPFANCVRLWAIWEIARRTKHFRLAR